jgi:hypothetical protein
MLTHAMLSLALGAQYFVPVGPGARPTAQLPAQYTSVYMPQPVELVTPVPPQGASRGPGAVAALAFVAGAAVTFTAFRSTGPTMQASEGLSLNGKPLIAGISDEAANKVWDPLELGSQGTEQTLAWFRHAEIKHSRAAMLASVGYLVQVNGVHFPGMISPSAGLSFADLSAMTPYAAWEATPVEGKLQIAAVAFIIELMSESMDTHYMRGGTPGVIGLKDYFQSTKMSAEESLRRETAELKHGRAAMLFLASIIAANNIPGSVPALTGATQFLG